MIKKNLFYNSLLSVSQLLFPLITFPYASRILGPHGIGTVNFIDSFTQYFILFSALGIPVYGVREIAKSKHEPDGKLSKTFNEIFTLHVLSACVFSVLYLVLALSLPSLRKHFDIVLVGIGMLLFSAGSIEWFFQGMEQFGFITARSITVRSISVIALFVFMHAGAPPVVYYSISAGGYILNSICNLFFLRKYVQVKPVLNIKQHIRPLVVILGSNLAISVYLFMDNIILGFIKGETAVGFYSLAVRIVRIPFAVLNAAGAVIVPQVSQAYSRGDIPALNSLADKSFSFTCVAGIPIAMGLFVASPFLVHLFGGDNFSESVIVLQLLSPVIIIIGLSSLFGMQLLTPMGKEKYLLRAVVVGMVISLVVNLCIIPFFSYKGAAVTNLLTECAVTATSFYFVRRYVKLQMHLNIFFQCLPGALLFIPIAWGMRALPINYTLREILIIAACMLTYGVYVWFFVRNQYITSAKQMVLQKIPGKLNFFYKQH
ncbi:flippase [Deminuibacter soli]|uniref:Flippase n=1 Tax=Deminuibacter soli TaxID=2291815 RepID=A0A3E1NFC1_9BACT|nr:flippase [Deminuibacter soli]RFM26673.1 flippase [Deminuibacter soli]